MIEVPRKFWRCTECVDPFTGGPLEVVDSTLSAQNEEIARDAWRARFGEELPPPLPPGRRPGRSREERVTVLFTEDELTALDRLRGQSTRSDFIRKAVLRKKAG